MKKTNDTPFGRQYIAVRSLCTGDCIINLGIIKNIFPNQPDGTTKISFEPTKMRSVKSVNFHPNDTLLQA